MYVYAKLFQNFYKIDRKNNANFFAFKSRLLKKRS